MPRPGHPSRRGEVAPVAAALAEYEDKIISELLAAQGEPVDIGGYYRPDDAKCKAAMRPSPTLNGIIDGIRSHHAAGATS